MKEYEHAVGKHYDESAFAGEHERLKRHPVEFRITLRALARWLPPRGAICAEIGVGTGAYSERLAEGGYSLHLVDVSARLLDATADRLRSGGYGALLLGTHRQSATDLEALQSGSCDAVIALGPLYHLIEAGDRQRAVREFRRILRPNGILFAAGLGRLAFLRDLFLDVPRQGAAWRDRCMKFIEDGDLNPAIAPRIGYAHLSTTSEFESLFTTDFEKIALWGVDSFTGRHQHRLAYLEKATAKAWLDIVEATAALPEALGCADHLLYVGRRRETV